MDGNEDNLRSFVQEGDLACTPIAAVLQRSEAIEFASYVGGDGTGILVKQPIPYLSFFGLTMAFSLNVNF